MHNGQVFVAGLFHETHCFVEERTGIDRFDILRGEDLLSALGDSSPLGGALECLRSAGWQIIPGADYRAMPGGIVADEVVAAFRRDVESSWRENADAIFLILHGAMVSETLLDVEGEVLRWIRTLPGAAGLPLFGVCDLHANFSPLMAEQANAILAYRKNPHTDARETAIQAAALLEPGCVPRMHSLHTGLVWLPERTGTGEDPMLSLEAAARSLEEEEEEILAINISAGFAYSDTPDMGVSIQLSGWLDRREAMPHLERLRDLALQRDAQTPAVPAMLVKEAIDILEREPAEGLTVLVESSDNIGGGAPGDGTGLLRELVERKVADAAVCINDPAAVDVLSRVTIGSSVELDLGGRGSRLDPGPFRLVVELLGRSDGRFELEDKHSHLASMSGSRFDMGPCALVRKDGVLILITSRKTPPFDLGQWRSQGVDPEKLRAIVVKAAVAHRQAYDPIATRSIRVDTPGPCATRLEHLPYRHCQAVSAQPRASAR